MKQGAVGKYNCVIIGLLFIIMNLWFSEVINQDA